MNLMASLKRMRYARKAHETLLGKAAFRSLVVAGVGVCLGIGAETAAAATLQQEVGPLQFDFLYPNITTDQNLGTYAFPDTGQTVSVPFGVGIGTNLGIAPVNIFDINVTPTSIVVSQTPTINNAIGFTNEANGIIKMTTLDSSLIKSVSLVSQNGITLNPGNFLFGANFFQVDLSHNSLIQPGASLVFSTTYDLSATETPVPVGICPQGYDCNAAGPVPEPATFAVLGAGLLGLIGLRWVRA